MSKKKSIQAKIVKHAHRRRFQEYVREKGRDKSTIGYVYWSMFLRSGSGNMFELEESLFLADLGLTHPTLSGARKTLYEDGWLSKGKQVFNPETGRWGLTRWTVNTEPVVKSVDIGTDVNLTDVSSTDVSSTDDGSTDISSVDDTVVLHSLYADASTSSSTASPSTLPVYPSGVTTSGSSKEEKKQRSLATLTRMGVEEQAVVDHTLSNSKGIESASFLAEEKTKAKPEPEIHWGVGELETMWHQRTTYLFTPEDRIAASDLIMAHSLRVVKAVLSDTLYNDKRKSSGMRWNNFQVFARNWERNHEEYLAVCAKNKRPPVTKFKIYAYDIQQKSIEKFREQAKWLTDNGKLGDWSLSYEERREYENYGATIDHIAAVIRYIREDGLLVSKQTFIDLIVECAALPAETAAVAAHFAAAAVGKGFDPEEA